MQKVRTIYIEFDAEIEGWEIPAFRGAISQKAGHQHILFHNHLGKESFRYAYPVIQYKRYKKHPVIFCIGEGIDEIHHFFEKSTWDISISGRTLPMRIARLQMNQFNVGIWNRMFPYTIRNWVALNSENYQKYKLLEDDQSRLLYLENLLMANIISFAKGIGWDVDQPIMLRILQMDPVRQVTFKEQKVNAFNLHFAANVSLPPHIGLGKGVSLGFGVIRKKRMSDENDKNT